MKCTLCHSDTVPFFYSENYDRSYLQCTCCKAVVMDAKDYVSAREEKARYETHNNDMDDPGYIKFVSPVVDKITGLFSPGTAGLDYGSGPGPVITNILRDRGYTVNTFDPYFDNNTEALEQEYDYVFCCEVIEHFHQPDLEFKKLKELLKPGGKLICKTDPITGDTDFKKWYYKNDETHVIFYHPESFEWIKKNMGFSDLEIEGRLITYTA